MRIKIPSGAAWKDFLKKTLGFVTALSKDARIPPRDKAVLAVFIALIVSPFDIIPDFIPVFGQIDDFILAVIILDYVLNRLPEDLVLSHFPWNPAHFARWRKRLRFVSLLVPAWARARIWKIGKAAPSAG